MTGSDGTCYNYFSEISCSEVSKPANGFIEYTTATSETSSFGYGYLTTATYGCDEGYVWASGDRVRTCVGSTLAPGEWSGSPSVCESKQ